MGKKRCWLLRDEEKERLAQEKDEELMKTHANIKNEKIVNLIIVSVVERG